MKPPVGYVLSGDRRAASGRRGDAAAFLYAVELLADSAGIETFSSTRRYPWGYAQVILAPTIRRVHIFHEGGQAEPAPVQEFDLKFLSGVTRGSESVTVGDTDYLRDFKATTNAWTTSLGSAPAKEDTFYDEELLAVEAHESMDVGAVYQTQVIKACFYSGKMAQLVQALLGYGKPGDDTPDELTEVLAGKVLYDFRWARCHGLTQDEDGNWWLVEISVTNGVLAQRLPLLTESADVRIDVDNDLEQWLETTFGGIPSGKSFRTGANLTADIAEGRVFRLATTGDMADYFDKSAFCATYGWSFNPAGTEAHNTCYAYDGDEVHSYHYKLAITITADIKTATLSEVSTGRLTRKGTSGYPDPPPEIPLRFMDAITFDVSNVPAEIITSGPDIPPEDAPLACLHIDGDLHVIVANGVTTGSTITEGQYPTVDDLEGTWTRTTSNKQINRKVSCPLLTPSETRATSDTTTIVLTSIQSARTPSGVEWGVLMTIDESVRRFNYAQPSDYVRVGYQARDGYTRFDSEYEVQTLRDYESGDESAGDDVDAWAAHAYGIAGEINEVIGLLVQDDPSDMTGHTSAGYISYNDGGGGEPDFDEVYTKTKLTRVTTYEPGVTSFVLPNGSIFDEEDAGELMVPSMLGPTEHVAIPGDPPFHIGALLASEAANTDDDNYTFVGYI